VPRIPELARRLPGWIHQLSPSEYCNPDELPDGGAGGRRLGDRGFSLQRKSGDQAASLPSRPCAIRGCLAATGGRTLYIYPELYSTRARSAPSTCFALDRRPRKNATNSSPTSSRRWAGSASPMPAANYVAPQLYNKHAHRVIEANGGEVVFEEYYPIDQAEYSAIISNSRRHGRLRAANHFFGETTPCKKAAASLHLPPAAAPCR
jgi:hypothetical protein